MSRLNGFLAGVRVVDLSRYLPGPLATLMLADMGAEVLKVEGPEGDGIRAIGPRLPDGSGCDIDIDIALADVVMPLQTLQLADLAATGRCRNVAASGSTAAGPVIRSTGPPTAVR